MYTIRQNPSPMHYDGRHGSSIDKIILHHGATTDFDGIGRTFQIKEVSATYGVGRNNNADQYVDEADASWNAGNRDANLTSISIEHVNSTGAPDWDIAPETFNTGVELTRDVAKRNGLFPVVPFKTLFPHGYFSPTACPAKLKERLQEYADAVNNGVAEKNPVNAHHSPDQVLEIGSQVQFAEYRVDALAFVGGIWQVKTNALCPEGFTWDENGVPAEPILETSDNDQILAVGSRYKLPGTFTVQNLGQYLDRWMVQLNINGWNLWVDAETLTEV